MAGQNYVEIAQEIRDLVSSGTIRPRLQPLADHFEINYQEFRKGLLALDPPISVSVIKEWAKDVEKDDLEPYEGKARVRHKKSLNEWNIQGSHPEIHTVEQLLEYCEVDLTIWRVESQDISAWPTTARLKDQDLEWEIHEDEEGIKRQLMSGHSRWDNKLTSKTNLKVGVKLVRIEPISYYPVVKTVSFDLKLPPKKRGRKPKKNGVERWFFLGDWQLGYDRPVNSMDYLPYHDRRVLDIAYQILGDNEFDGVGFLGDEGDWAEVSKFVKMPEFTETTQPMIIELNYWLSLFRSAKPEAEMVMVDSNHPARMRRLLAEHYKFMFGLRAADDLEDDALLSPQKLMGLKKLDIKFIPGYPDSVYYITPTIAMTHSDIARSQSGATANAMADRHMYTTVFGHIHKAELVRTRKRLDMNTERVYTNFSPGCACHIDGRVPGSKSWDSWQQGVGVMEFYPDQPEIPPQCSIVGVHEGKAVYNDKLYVADPDVDKRATDILIKKLAKIPRDGV